MYALTSVYGRDAYELWVRERPRDLRKARESAPATADTVWPVTTFSELVDAVSFLSVMNKRLHLAFRGQSSQWPPLPTLLRDTWQPPTWGHVGQVGLSGRAFYRTRLEALGELVYDVCARRGLPRWRTLRDVQEARWAVIQHYELWPTPLVDLTRSLRVAASFAMRARAEQETGTISGFLDVVGLPYRTGSISYSLDDQMLVADLDAVCPPVARRPHLQEGLLVGRFPTYGDKASDRKANDLRNRVVARFELTDAGGADRFWSQDFPRLREGSLLPAEAEDPLLRDFQHAIEYQAVDDRVDWAPRR